MKKKGMILLTGVVLLFSFAVVSYAENIKVKVIVDDANIRLKPDLTSQIVAQVPLGSILQAQGKKGEWYLVNLPADEKGFVVSGYIHQSIVQPMVESYQAAPQVQQPAQQSAPPQVQQPTYAPAGVEIEPKSGIGVRAGYSMLSEDLYGGGLMYGANFSIGINKFLAVEISGLRFQSDVEGDAAGLSKGKLTVMPIQLSIQIRFPANPQFIPYVHGGGGFYMNSFTVDSTVTDDWEGLGFTIEEEVENKIGFHFGAGIDYFFTENIAFNADFRYCIATTKGSWTITDTVGSTSATGSLEDLKLGGIMFGGGLKFCF